MGLTSWGFEPVRPGRLRVTAALALYRRRLRRRRWIQDLLAVLGIGAGVALLYATQVASTSLSGPVKHINAGIVGAGQLQVLARGGTTIPEDTYNKVIALPGVARAAPVLQVPGNLVGPKGQSDLTFYGADPRIVKLRGSLVVGFSSSDLAHQESVVIPGPVAQSVGLRFGNDARIQLDGRTITIPSAVAGRTQIGDLASTSIALLPLAYLQRLAGARGQVTRILVQAEHGKAAAVRDELRALHIGGADVHPATYDSQLFDEATKPTTQASTIFAVLSALVGWLFAICALLVTASDRRKLVVQQRRQGFPPSATLTTLLVDAAVIGVAGVVLGLLGGELLSREGFRSDVSFLSGAFAMGNIRVVTWQSVALAVAGGLLAATVGVLAPVRELIIDSVGRRRRDAGTTAEHGDATRRFIGTGIAAVIVAVVVTVAAPGSAVLGLLVLAGGVACFLPPVLAGTIALLRALNRHSRRSSAAVELALHQLVAKRWRARALAIATTGAIAVFGAMSLQGARVNLQRGLEGLAHELNAPAAVWVTAPGAGSSIGTSSFAPTDLRRLERVPGAAGVSTQPAGLVDLDGERAWALGEPADAPLQIAPSQILDGNARQAYARLRAEGWATVSQGLADRLGLHVGDRLALPSPRPIAVRVAATTTNLAWSSGTIVLGAADFRRAWAGSAAIVAYQVRAAPTTDANVLARDVRTALGPRTGLRVETAAQRADRQGQVAASGLARLKQIATLTLVAAVLAMSAAMIGLLWQHRPIVAGHKFRGLSTGLLWRALLIETGTLFGVGVLVGGVLGLLGQVLCTQGVAAVTGYPVVHGVRLGIAAETIGVMLVASLLIVLVPGYLVARALPSPRE